MPDPILVRPIIKGYYETLGTTAATRVAALRRLDPADARVLGHFGCFEEDVRILTDLGEEVFRYLNAFFVHPESANWNRPDFQRILWEWANDYDVLLEWEGQRFHFPYYGPPNYLEYPQLVDWSQTDDDMIDEMVSAFIWLNGPLLIDLVFKGLRPWMFLETVTEGDLHLILDPAMYTHQYQKFVTAMSVNSKGPGGREVIVNADPEFNLGLGHRVEFENSNLASSDEEWVSTFDLWKGNPGSMLEIHSPHISTSTHIMKVTVRVQNAISWWAKPENGGYLYVDDDQAMPTRIVRDAIRIREENR